MNDILIIALSLALSITAGLIYKYHRTLKGALVALCCGTLAWVVVMIVANLIITPLFMGVPTQAVAQLLIPAIIPFNLLKAPLSIIMPGSGHFRAPGLAQLSFGGYLKSKATVLDTPPPCRASPRVNQRYPKS